jgi:hypothetical protein
MREVTLPIETRTTALDFESFFRAEYRPLCQALVLLVGDPLEAEEIAQETMTRVLERWDRVGVMDSPAPSGGPDPLQMSPGEIGPSRYEVWNSTESTIASSPARGVHQVAGGRVDVMLWCIRQDHDDDAWILEAERQSPGSVLAAEEAQSPRVGAV